MIRFVAWLLIPQAAERSALPRVDVISCEALDAAEIERVFLLELDSDEVPASDLHVLVECSDSGVAIRIESRASGRTIGRVVEPPSRDDPSRNRIVALAAAQLLATDWMSLEAPREPPVPAPPPRPEPQRAPRRPVLSRWIFSPEGGVGIRRFDDPWILPRVSLRLARRGRRFQPFAEIVGETTTLTRPEGDVRFLSLSTRGGVELSLLGPIRPFATLGLSYLRFDGHPGAGFVGSTTDGIRGVACVGIRPTADFVDAEVGLTIAASATLPSFDAAVTGGARVSTGVLFAEAGAWVGW